MYECEICGTRLDPGEKCDCKKEDVSDNALTVKIEPFSPISKIVFNKDELIERAQAAVGEYANILVTAENLKEMKSKKAEFNKVIKALDTERIKQKKLFTEPVTAFEKDVKEVISVLAAAVTNIDGQIKKIDEQEKEEKQNALKKYFDETVGDLKEIVSFDRIYQKAWENKSEKLTSCKKDIDLQLTKIRSELKTIGEMCKCFPVECKAEYLKSFILVDALSKEEELIKKKEALEQINRSQTEQSWTEQPQSEQSQTEQAQTTVNAEKAPEKTFEKLFAVTFKVNGTITELNKLKAIMDGMGITYEVIK